MTAMFLCLLVALLLVAAAAWVFGQGQLRARQEGFAERVGEVSEAEIGDQLAGLRHLEQIRNPVTRWVCHQFWGAGIDMAPGTANVILLVYAVVVVLLILVNLLVGIALGLAVAGITWLILRQRVAARRRAIADQLPDYLEYVLRSLAAGNTLEGAMQGAALEVTDPCRALFLSVSRQVRLGASLEGTLAEAADIHKLRALYIMAMAARVNRRFGGSMRRVIKSLIAAIRQQDAATRELKALTGETRFSAWVVAAIPIAIAGVFVILNPGYYQPLLDNTGGRIAIGVAVGLQLLGIFIIWRMIASLRDAAL